MFNLKLEEEFTQKSVLSTGMKSEVQSDSIPAAAADFCNGLESYPKLVQGTETLPGSKLKSYYD